MFGFPASVRGPALTATTGLAVSQLLPPCIRVTSGRNVRREEEDEREEDDEKDKKKEKEGKEGKEEREERRRRIERRCTRMRRPRISPSQRLSEQHPLSAQLSYNCQGAKQKFLDAREKNCQQEFLMLNAMISMTIV